jgi:hypothetical protein
MNAERMTFAQALAHPEFGILGHAQVSRYLDMAETALKQGGAFGEPTAEAMALSQTPMPPALLAQLAQEQAAEAKKAEAVAETSGMGQPPIEADSGNDNVTEPLDETKPEADGQPELVTVGGDSGQAVKKGGKNGRSS